MSDYKYTVITRDNAEACGMAPEFWQNHPDWNYFVRTNHRWPGKPMVWISGGGATLKEAIESAEFGLLEMIFKPVEPFFHTTMVGSVMLIKPERKKLIGEESETVIKN